MNEYCGTCAKLDKGSKDYWGEYYCTEIRKYVMESKQACSCYIKKAPGGYTPAGCFITTIVCKMLNYPDDCELLTTLRGFRENYLKQSTKGQMLLQEYDQIGPIISERLKEESALKAVFLTKTYLIPCALDIKKENYAEAISCYKAMVQELISEYHLENVTVDFERSTPIEELGKGRIRDQKASI